MFNAANLEANPFLVPAAQKIVKAYREGKIDLDSTISEMDLVVWHMNLKKYHVFTGYDTFKSDIANLEEYLVSKGLAM